MLKTCKNKSYKKMIANFSVKLNKIFFPKKEKIAFSDLNENLYFCKHIQNAKYSR